jgi:hypothetical protein
MSITPQENVERSGDGGYGLYAAAHAASAPQPKAFALKAVSTRNTKYGLSTSSVWCARRTEESEQEAAVQGRRWPKRIC